MFNFKREGEFPLEEGQKTDTVSGLIRFWDETLKILFSIVLEFNFQ